MRTMMYLETQQGSQNVFRADMKYGVYALLVSAALIAGMISIARPAQAQGAEQYNGNNTQGSRAGASFGPDFPFGYGGGPRVPTPPASPNATAIVVRIIAQINSMFDRIFNR